MAKLEKDWAKWSVLQWAAACDYGIQQLTAGNRMERREMLRPVAALLGFAEDDEFLAEFEDRCKKHKTLDQEQSAEAEEKNVELDEGVLAVNMEVAEMENAMNARAAEAIRALAAILDVGLVDAKWGWDWRKPGSRYLRPGMRAEDRKGWGVTTTADGREMEWKWGAVLIFEEGQDKPKEVLTESRIKILRVEKKFGRQRVIFAEWRPKMRKLNLELIGQRAIAGIRQWMPAAVGHLSQADVARRVVGKRKGSKQLQNYHEGKVQERLKEVAAERLTGGERTKGTEGTKRSAGPVKKMNGKGAA